MARWVPRLLIPTTSSTVRPLQNSVWRCLSATRRSFCVVSRPSTGTHHRPRNNRNCGLHLANVLRRRRRLSYWPESLRPQFSGIHKVWSASTTWSRGSMPNYWSNLTPNCWKKTRFSEEKIALPPWQGGRALAHTSSVATAKLVELCYELLPHRLYSPDFALCDIFLLPNLKKSLAGQKFKSNEEVIAATEAYFACRPPENVFFRRVEEVGASLCWVYGVKRSQC